MQSMPDTVYIGTYTKDDSQAEHRAQGIFACRVSADGQLSLLSAAVCGPNPSFLARHPSLPVLYCVNETVDGGVSAFAVDPQTGGLNLLNRQPTGGADPCHLSLDPSGSWLMAANYNSGSLTILPVLPDGRLGPGSDYVEHAGALGPNPQRQDAAHAHMLQFDPGGRFVLASDLGLDRLYVYRLEGESGRLRPHTPAWVAMPPGSGPRHFVFHPNRRFLYVANELGSTVTACTWDGVQGLLKPFLSRSTLPAGFTGQNDVADIHLDPAGRFLYVSNRGHDSLAIFSVDGQDGSLVARGHALTGGRTPRNFAIDPAGKFVLAANQDSDTVVTLRIDPQSGQLAPAGFEAAIPRPICIIFW
jgi:6-phosphogluconolactonase